MAKSNYGYKLQDIHAENLHTLKERIKKGEPAGCYFFYGDEEYTKIHYTGELLKNAGSNLNITSFYGADITLVDFLSACETNAVESFDMFSLDADNSTDDDDGAYRIIKLYSPDLSDFSKNDLDYFYEFLSELPEKVIVIFWYYADAENVTSKDIYKKIEKTALTVNFRREPVGSSVLISWILRHFVKAKINVERYVAVHLCQTVGNSMTDLKNEIEKLIDYLRFENRDTLEKKDVDLICIKSTSAQIFDISNGALAGDFIKSARALNVLRDKREKPIIILGTISKAVNDLCVIDSYIKKGVSLPAIAEKTKIPDFVIKNDAALLTSRGRDFKGSETFPLACARICLEYDKKIKSSRTDSYELLLELIFKIAYAGKSSS